MDMITTREQMIEQLIDAGMPDDVARGLSDYQLGSYLTIIDDGE